MKTKRYGMLTAAVAGLMLSGCATLGAGLVERLAPRLLAQLGPAAGTLLGPEVTQVVNLLQSRGAIAVERGFGAKFALVEARIQSGGIAGPAEAQGAFDKTAARMKLLRQLRTGNDYSQMVRNLSPADRAALDAARRDTDTRYEVVQELLFEKGAVDQDADSARVHALICTGPSEVIADNDPALELFREKEPNSLADRKVALAIERVNSCDDPVAAPARLSDVGRPASAAAPARSTELRWDDMIGLCRAAILAGETARVAAIFAVMPEAVRQAATLVCSAYAEGVRDARGNLPAGPAISI